MSRLFCCPSLEKTARVGVNERAPCCVPFPLAWNAGPAPCLKLCWKGDCCPPGGPDIRLVVQSVGHPVTLLPVVLAAATRPRIGRASTQPLSASPYYCSFFLLSITHSGDSTFWTRLNAVELIRLLNSRPSLRGFSRDRVHEIQVLLSVPLVVVVVVVVSHIQRIGCQPEKTALHGGQSRSWFVEQGRENKIKSLAAFPPPNPPHCSFGENK